VARMGEGRNVYRVLVGKREGKRPPERPRRRWEDGIRMNLRGIGWGGVWSGSTWLRQFRRSFSMDPFFEISFVHPQLLHLLYTAPRGVQATMITSCSQH
jgi:hypothetical protein